MADAPDPNEEVPQELPQSLLHAPPESEAPVDLKDPLVEDATPLNMVPPVGDDSVVPLVDK
ncbi:UNVERIFIED_CONTAM: hypothetical protein Slati_2906400 [Sesamum latifolium]|uniref:Uncharacterized protein n=1 Tax=Sesamum latifolium TaxID=2727402 RepID=A0AAW2VHY8_9LAMI